MIDGQVLLIAVACAGIWFAGHETIKGVKKMDHAIAAKFRHYKKPADQTTKAKDAQ